MIWSLKINKQEKVSPNTEQERKSSIVLQN